MPMLPVYPLLEFVAGRAPPGMGPIVFAAMNEIGAPASLYQICHYIGLNFGVPVNLLQRGIECILRRAVQWGYVTCNGNLYSICPRKPPIGSLQLLQIHSQGGAGGDQVNGQSNGNNDAQVGNTVAAAAAAPAATAVAVNDEETDDNNNDEPEEDNVSGIALYDNKDYGKNSGQHYSKC